MVVLFPHNFPGVHQRTSENTANTQIHATRPKIVVSTVAHAELFWNPNQLQHLPVTVPWGTLLPSVSWKFPMPANHPRVTTMEFVNWTPSNRILVSVPQGIGVRTVNTLTSVPLTEAHPVRMKPIAFQRTRVEAIDVSVMPGSRDRIVFKILMSVARRTLVFMELVKIFGDLTGKNGQPFSGFLAFIRCPIVKLVSLVFWI